MKKALLTALFLSSTFLCADEGTTTADAHAPIGVMGDHLHQAGEWMISYRFMRMSMDGMRDNTDNLSAQQVLQNFMVTPTQMDMDMHMLGAMYAPNNRFTLTAMLPYIENQMDHVTRMGGQFTTQTKGVGDFKLGGLVKLKRNPDSLLHMNLSLSLPTGEYKERDDTPAMANALLPYPMQPGSGTYDLTSGLTFVKYYDQTSVGLQGLYTYRFGENDFDYTLGNQLAITAWAAYRFKDWISGSFRLASLNLQSIDGANPNLNPAMVPTADPNNHGGDKIEALFGLNFITPKNAHRFAIELGKPIYQNLNGPQMRTDWTAMIGWQKAFN